MILVMLLTAIFAQAVGQEGEVVDLPEPARDGATSLEAALQARRSVREFSREPLSLAQLGQLLWAAQGINRPSGGRTAPSAGALYPLEIFVVAGEVRDLPRGLYRYRPASHDLVTVSRGDVRGELVGAALSQQWVSEAPAVLVLAAVYRRTTVKYGERGDRYVHMEIGHAAQNVYLQAAALGLATTLVGAFQDERVREVLGLGPEAPLGILPIGRP